MRTMVPAALPQSLPALHRILNIYAGMNRGVFKVVIESMTAVGDGLNPRDLFPADDEEGAAFERCYAPRIEGAIYFDAICQGETKRYGTSACLLELPAQNITAVMNLIALVNDAAKLAQKKYDSVLFSTSSVLACYQEALTTYQPLYEDSTDKYWQIVNDLPVPIETFIYQPEHTTQVEHIRSRLVAQILSLRDAPAYEELQAFFRRYCINNMTDVFTSPVGCLEKNYHISLFNLLDSAIALEKRSQLAEDISAVLTAVSDQSACQYFLSQFHHLAKGSLVAECCRKRASNGGIYNCYSPEMQFLLHAEFDLLPDGRLYIKAFDNPAYLHHYAAGKDDHDECEIAFKHWAESLDLAFDQDADFHRLMIFTPDSSQKLKARGLHFSASFWDNDLIRVKRIMDLTAVHARFFKAESVVATAIEACHTYRLE